MRREVGSGPFAAMMKLTDATNALPGVECPGCHRPLGESHLRDAPELGEEGDAVLVCPNPVCGKEIPVRIAKRAETSARFVRRAWCVNPDSPQAVWYG